MPAKSPALLNQNIIESILILSNFYLPHPQQGRPTIELLSSLPNDQGSRFYHRWKMTGIQLVQKRNLNLESLR